jgi:phosphoglycerol transferase
VLNNAPSLLYIWDHGANEVAARRAPQEAEIFGLRISQMLLPVNEHRLPYFRHLKDTYNSLAPEVNENGAATLGVIADFGFLFLLARLLWRSGEKDGELFRPLATLTVAAVFFGSMGGFGSLFSFVVYPQFRCYNRISVYIAFLSLFAVALLLDALKRRMELRQYSTWLWYGSLAAVLLIGVLDQTTPAFVPNYEELKVEDHNDATFVKKIEAAVPRGAMIFQLPTVPFPNNPPVWRMVDYDLLKGYLHSNTLRWSYGSVKGREDARWGELVTHQPIHSMVQRLVFAGFSGIYVDRYGYSDSGRSVEYPLSQLLGEPPLVSENGRLAFFNLMNLAESIRAKYTPGEWREKHDEALQVSAIPSNESLLHSLRVHCQDTHDWSVAQCQDLYMRLTRPTAPPE